MRLNLNIQKIHKNLSKNTKISQKQQRTVKPPPKVFKMRFQKFFKLQSFQNIFIKFLKIQKFSKCILKTA